MQEKGFLFLLLKISYLHPYHCRSFFMFLVSAFAAPVTHQDQGRQVFAGWPFPLKADQKIFGSRPCPMDFLQL
jgi:hypothetical protein